LSSKLLFAGRFCRQAEQSFVEWLVKQEPWKLSNGADHLIPAHHPAGLQFGLPHLRAARFLVADFGRQPEAVSSYDGVSFAV
jgi:hypothetical protein